MNESVVEGAALDADFQEVTEGEEAGRVRGLQNRWTQLEAIVGTDQRLDLVARDIVEHYEQRLEAMEGKAMIVCMSRRICVELYEKIADLRPQWHGEEDDEGRMKVVMTGSASDPPDWQQHIRSKSRREALANRFRDPDDPRHSPRHVANRLRRPIPTHHVPRQAHARPRPHASHSPRQPRL
jgi:type I restriction enzyme, R subunit